MKNICPNPAKAMKAGWEIYFNLMRYFFLFLLERLGALPFRWRRALGGGLGYVVRICFRKRCNIVARNLLGAFPRLSEKEREELLRAHFRCLGKSLMDGLWALTASPDDLRRFIVVQNEEQLNGERPIIAFVPHFLGMDTAGLRLSKVFSRRSVMFLYKRVHNSFWDFVVSRQRCRFGDVGFSITENNTLWHCVRHLKTGGILYYSPDINAKQLNKNMAFAPFLGVPQAATYTTIGRLAKITGARVLPCLVSMTDNGYQMSINPPLDNLVGAEKQIVAEIINNVVWRTCPTSAGAISLVASPFQNSSRRRRGFLCLRKTPIR